MDQSVLAALAQALAPELERQKATRYGLSGVALKHDLPSGISTTPSTTQYSHGPGGLLTFPGVDPAIFHTVMGADSLLSQIPTKGSVFTNPTFGVLTGVSDTVGSEVNGVCDNAPEAGLIKACMLTSVFGRYERATPVIDIGRLGQQIDRADPMDLRLVGTPFVGQAPFGISGGAPADLFTNEVSRKFWELDVAFFRLLARQLWTGNPTNNSGGGGYKEMTGLQLLVNDGQVDAETGVACPSTDSLIINANYARLDVAASATNVIAMLTNALHQLAERARRTGVAPVRWTLAMRSELFYELTSIWPCNYLTYRCAPITDLGALAPDMVRMRDEMRAGRYLVMDGTRYEVVFDDGIPENGGNAGNTLRGCFSSDIYILPMSVVGGQSVLYMEYFQYANPSIQDALGNMVLGRIEGAFLTWPRQTNMCVQWQTRIEPRLVLRTPWLAARIQNVTYCPIQHTPQPFPDDDYFVDGGKGSRSGPSYYQLWNQ